MDQGLFVFVERSPGTLTSSLLPHFLLPQVGQPAPSMLPLALIREASAAKFAEEDPLYLQYGHIYGFPKFRGKLHLDVCNFRFLSSNLDSSLFLLNRSLTQQVSYRSLQNSC